jgi:hypothetical protein
LAVPATSLRGRIGDVRPLVLLDVDGVLNAVAFAPDPRVWPHWRRGHAVADGKQWPITWSPAVVAAVREWLSLADVQWLTTWGHDANVGLRALLELPELPIAGTYADVDAPLSAGTTDDAPAAHAGVAPAARDELTGRWWKFDVVRRLVRSDPARPLVWIDDDLAGQRDIRGWMEREARCLLVAPTMSTGLRPDELSLIRGFLDDAQRPV